MAETDGFRVHPVALDKLGSVSRDAALALEAGLRNCVSTPVPSATAFGNLGVSGEVHRSFTRAAARGVAAAGSLATTLDHDVERLAHTAATYVEPDRQQGSVFSRRLDALNPLD
ncbi:MAG: hypothetical protein LC713_00425 [Actinobacteria bacterium]|nr:hypothetical protein [Actinomycetota bacterium]